MADSETCDHEWNPPVDDGFEAEERVCLACGLVQRRERLSTGWTIFEDAQ